MKKNFKNLVVEINELLQKYELGEYSFERLDIVTKLMPVEDEKLRALDELASNSEQENEGETRLKRCRIVHHPNDEVELICD